MLQASDLQDSPGGELVAISCSSLPNVNNINSISNRTILKEYKSKLRFSNNLSKLHIHCNKKNNSLDQNFVTNPSPDNIISADISHEIFGIKKNLCKSQRELLKHRKRPTAAFPIKKNGLSRDFRKMVNNYNNLNNEEAGTTRRRNVMDSWKNGRNSHKSLIPVAAEDEDIEIDYEEKKVPLYFNKQFKIYNSDVLALQMKLLSKSSITGTFEGSVGSQGGPDAGKDKKNALVFGYRSDPMEFDSGDFLPKDNFEEQYDSLREFIQNPSNEREFLPNKLLYKAIREDDLFESTLNKLNWSGYDISKEFLTKSKVDRITMSLNINDHMIWPND
jgi:hypothetical protein